MGLFRRTPDPEHERAAAEREADHGDSLEAQQFVTAARRGDLDAADQLLDAYLAAGEPVNPPLSLIDRAAAMRLALRQDRLDDAATALRGWQVPFGDMMGQMLLPEDHARLRILGLCLIGYFDHPGSHEHASYDELMDGKLAAVAKSARLAGDPFFDRIYASVKSQRALTRPR
jgi:hypothetical protein